MSELVPGSSRPYHLPLVLPILQLAVMPPEIEDAVDLMARKTIGEAAQLLGCSTGQLRRRLANAEGIIDAVVTLPGKQSHKFAHWRATRHAIMQGSTEDICARPCADCGKAFYTSRSVPERRCPGCQGT